MAAPPQQAEKAWAKRLIDGVMANAVSFASGIGMQLAMVPVLVHLWGLSLFGVWVIVSTIPTYLALSNIGIAAVASNELAGLLTTGQRPRAQVIYSTAITAIGTLALTILIAGTVIAAVVPASIMPADPAVSPDQMRKAIMALVVYGATVIAADLPMAKYRATGRYARGTSLMTAVLLAERLALMGMAAFGFVPAAVAFAIVRLIGTAWMLVDVSRAHVDLRPRLSDASWAEAKRLTVLGSGMILFTITMAINLQGPVVVLGAVMAPAAVGLFSATRTLTRLGLQVTGIVTSSINSEFSIVWGSEFDLRRRRLFALAWGVSTAVMVGSLAVLLLFGQSLTRLWLVGTALPSFTLIALVASGSFLQGCWLAIASLILSANKQFAFTPAAFAISVLMIALATVVVPGWGLEGMAAVLCLAEALMVIWVFRQAARVGVGSVRDAPGDLAEMFRDWRTKWLNRKSA